MMDRIIRLAAVAGLVGVVQSVIEALFCAVWYREGLLAPYRFFTVQWYDAFTKLYFFAAEALPLPVPADRFLAQGFVPKLVLLPQLAAVNLFTASVVGLLLALAGPLLGLGGGVSRTQFARRALGAVVALQALVHVGVWVFATKVPMDPTPTKVAQNLLRFAIFDGTAVAIGVLALSAVVAGAVLSRAPLVAATASTAATVALLAAVGLGGGVSSAMITSAGSAGTASLPRANVILISIDSLRADHLGAYGYDRDTSPTIDALAGQGVLFRHCSSTTSWTLPAHVSLLTGRSLLGHGVVTDDRVLRDSVPTLAGALQDAGYSTKAIVSAPYLNSRYGFARGFDDYDDRTIAFIDNEDSYKSVTAPALEAAAVDWLQHRSGGEDPFFLFLHYWDVHYDYAPSPPYDTMFDADYTGSISGENFYFDSSIHEGMDARDLEHLLALYDGEIRLVDDSIGRLRGALQRLGLGENTVIVVTSDHGDEFFEHGRKGHHRTLYEEVLAVPLVVSVPGLVPQQASPTDEVSIVDVLPTILGIVGVPVPEDVEGRDLRPLWRGEARRPNPAVVAELYRSGSLNVQVSLVDSRKKMIHHFKQRFVRTYDLEAHPGEDSALANRGPEGHRLAARMRTWLNRRWRPFNRRNREEGVQPVVMDDHAMAELRALGYFEE